MSRRLAAFAATIILVAGCSSKGGTSRHATTSSTASTATSAALEHLLISDLPAGYTMAPDAKANTGPTDFEKAVKMENSADGRDLLTRAKFVAGYQRVWAAPGAQIVDYLYKFADADGANVYLQARVARASNTTPVSGQAQITPTPFDVPGVPGATGLATTGAGSASAGILFARGQYVVLLAVDNTSATDPRVAGRSLALQAYNKLPG